MRKFEKLSKAEYDKYSNIGNYDEVILPQRQTKKSAGYDFYLPYDIVFEKGKVTTVYTGIKAQMEEDEFLGIFVRSSIGIKKGLNLANEVAIIDGDYYNNSSNEGHIMLALLNTGSEALALPKGECVAQGIFYNYLVADGDADSEQYDLEYFLKPFESLHFQLVFPDFLF